MSADPKLKSTPCEENRMEAFINCIARLMARRWLREQQQEDEPIIQEELDDAGISPPLPNH